MNTSFSAYFEAIHHHPPFPWQVRLAQDVIKNGAFPPLLSLPTASGKTALLDIAVYALACEAERPPEQRRLPVRTFWVIDRRIVVDEAAHRARRIAFALEQALQPNANGNLPDSDSARALQEVALALLRLARRGLPLDSQAHQRARPLEIYVLRGGMPRELGLTRAPAQPLICLSTVDQVGSRLLFRGYGVRDNSLPLHAALIANDSLIVLDEAHLSRPFEQLLHRLQQYQRWAELPVGRPLQVLRMSATPHAQEQPPFQLDEHDRVHPILSRRLHAQKWVDLLEVPDSEHDSSLLKVLSEAVEKLIKPRQLNVFQTPGRTIGVVVNRVATARTLFEHLRSLAKQRPELNLEVSLLTGRTRPLDRARLLDTLLPRLAAQRDRTQNPSSTQLVVATQCIEAGADLDFDALLTECAPLDALRQRLGRLDRLGLRQTSPALIFARPSQINGKKLDPIYGEALTETWRWLKQLPQPLDLGIEGFERLLQQFPPPESCLAPTRAAPVLLPMALDLFSQTSPRPRVEPDPAPFLHGPERSAADVQLIWREGLTADLDTTLEQLLLLPPSNLEALALPLPTVRAWLLERRSDAGQPNLPALSHLTDQEGLTPPESESEPSKPIPPVLVWRGEDSHYVNLEAIRPGDTLILPCTLGGLDQYGWNPQAQEPVADLAEWAYLQKTGKPCLRLACADAHRGRAPLAELGKQLRVATKSEQNELLKEMFGQLQSWQTNPSEQETPPPAGAFLSQTGLLTMLNKLQRSGIQLISYADGVLLRSMRPQQPAEESGFTDEDNRSSSTGTGISLRAHLSGVMCWTESHARACGLPETLVADLRRAALWHDLGKADPRFQTLLHGGDEAAAYRAQEPLAKSVRELPSRVRASRPDRLPPPGFRHEALSVELLRDHPLLAKAHDAELILHLVGAHHGYARPFYPACDDSDPQTVTLELHGAHFESSSGHGLTRADGGVAERFFNLTRRYGWYGLAYLESLLRLADHRRSEQEQEGDTP